MLCLPPQGGQGCLGTGCEQQGRGTRQARLGRMPHQYPVVRQRELQLPGRRSWGMAG